MICSGRLPTKRQVRQLQTNDRIRLRHPRQARFRHIPNPITLFKLHKQAAQTRRQVSERQAHDSSSVNFTKVAYNGGVFVPTPGEQLAPFATLPSAAKKKGEDRVMRRHYKLDHRLLPSAANTAVLPYKTGGYYRLTKTVEMEVDT